MKKLLVTGGAGYIGSHTVVELLKAGFEVVVLDNCSNSSPKSLDGVFKITGKRPEFILGDILDATLVDNIFKQHNFDGVIHFAGFKSVPDSFSQPLDYYNNNVGGALLLLKMMKQYSVASIIFSSSATVYGVSNVPPFNERMLAGAPLNPYGMTKSMIETILSDLSKAEPSLSVMVLRYFNPVGAHPSGLIGESPLSFPGNLMPRITQVALGVLDKLMIYGDDYETADGSCVRDYIHVVDLARGHLAALEKSATSPGLHTVNLGTGKGYSVFDLLKTFQRVTGVKVPYEVAQRREGDVAACYADVDFAKNFINWRASMSLDEMCRDSWNWEIRNSKK